MATRCTPHASIEALESRIAPAVIIAPGGKVAHYTDLDGDRVTITISKGRLSASDFVMTSDGATVPDGESLVMLDLSDDSGEFHRANLTIAAKPGRFGGDGHADVGFINAGDGLTDLGRVFIDGDLGRIAAGDANDGTRSPGVRMLIAEDLGSDADGDVIGGIAKLQIGLPAASGNGSAFHFTNSVAAGFTINAGSLHLNSGGIVQTFPIGGSITGMSLVKTGTGLISITDNTFTGAALGSSRSLLGGSLTLSGPLINVINPLNNLATINTGAVISIANSNVLTQTTGGTLSLNGSFQTIGSGTLNLGSATIFNPTNPVLDLSTNLEIATPVFLSSGSSSLIKTGTGTLTLSGSTRLGNATISGGTLVISGSNPLFLPTGMITILGSAMISGGALPFTLPTGAKITTNNGTITFGTGNVVSTFTAPDGTVLDIGGATISFPTPVAGHPNLPTIELATLDIASAPTGTKKFEVQVGHTDAAIVQTRALYESLVASGWVASAPTLGADGKVASIKLTKSGTATISLGSSTLRFIQPTT